MADRCEHGRLPRDCAHCEVVSLRADVVALAEALGFIKQRWKFNDRQQHTHSWHDMADSMEVADAALARPGVMAVRAGKS